MATTLGSKAVGSTVKIKVNGAMKNCIVVHQGRPSSLYDASCDGTWLMMQSCYEIRRWHSSNVNDYANSEIHSYLNSTFLNLFDANIKAAIKQVKLPYRPGSGYDKTVNSGASGMSTKIFLLSGYEIGWTSSTDQNFPEDGAKLDYFETGTSADSKRIAYYNGKASGWWLRDPYTRNVGGQHPLYVYITGKYATTSCTAEYGIRPAFVMPSSLLVSDDGTVTTNTAPTTPSSITVPSQINGGSTITVEWGLASDAQGNLEGYKVERSTDGGSAWAQIYQGAGLSTTNTVPFGTETVMYRVKAYDSEGLYSGYRTSGQVTVINNTAPTAPACLTVPEHVQGGQPLDITWGEASDGENNLAGYSLERQVDGGEWETVYTGDALAFTDTITKGWQTVAYRVRAYDTVNAYSGFTTAEAREVNNNTPPAIACDTASGADLGVKTEGFAVPYSVSDEEGDEVTVTEAVDGTAWRTFAVELGAANSFTLGGVDFMRLLNGRHTLSVTANDGKSGAVHQLSFEKLVTSASVTLAQSMPADGPISVCVLSVSGSIPLDAAYTVEATNNANDDAPAWEDCTAAVRAGVNHVFANGAAGNGFAFNFRLHAARGKSGLGGYITSVQGGFQ